MNSIDYLSGLIFVLLTIAAITDTGAYYEKAGPRGLFVLFISLWVLGYVTGKYGGI